MNPGNTFAMHVNSEWELKLSNLPVNDLRSLQQEIEREIKKREKEEIAKAGE